MSISSFVRIITVAAVISCFMPVSARAEDKGVQASLDATPEVVHKAAMDALAVIGCEIKQDEPTHLEGYRKHKVGLFVGSGGETVSVSITAQAEGKTNVLNASGDRGPGVAAILAAPPIGVLVEVDEIGERAAGLAGEHLHRTLAGARRRSLRSHWAQLPPRVVAIGRQRAD